MPFFKCGVRPFGRDSKFDDISCRAASLLLDESLSVGRDFTPPIGLLPRGNGVSIFISEELSKMLSLSLRGSTSDELAAPGDRPSLAAITDDDVADDDVTDNERTDDDVTGDDGTDGDVVWLGMTEMFMGREDDDDDGSSTRRFLLGEVGFAAVRGGGRFLWETLFVISAGLPSLDPVALLTWAGEEEGEPSVSEPEPERRDSSSDEPGGWGGAFFERGGGYFGGGGREMSFSRVDSNTDGGLDPSISEGGLKGTKISEGGLEEFSIAEGGLLRLFPGEFCLFRASWRASAPPNTAPTFTPNFCAFLAFLCMVDSPS